MEFASLILFSFSAVRYGSAQLASVPHRMRNHLSINEVPSEEWGRRVLKTNQSNPNRKRFLEESMSMPKLENSMPMAFEIEASLPETQSSLPMLESMPGFSQGEEMVADDNDLIEEVIEGINMTDSTSADNDVIAPTPAQGEHKEAIEEPAARSSGATSTLPGLFSAACAIGAYTLM
mmetsp:Transcript_23634/g.48922  ORF Transcript_23634/g.48922 Transcript_23634/m.48922 type:complete len:177 (+) Transcript_23634:152-682(+)